MTVTPWVWEIDGSLKKINKNNKKPINQQDQSKTTFPAQNAAEIKISYWA